MRRLYDLSINLSISCSLGLAEKCTSSQPEDDEEGEKKMASPVRETQRVNTQASVVRFY